MHVTGEEVAGVLLLCIGGTAGQFSINLIHRMIDEINRTREPDDYISHFWFTPMKGWTIFREYDRLYPHGRLSFYVVLAYGVIFVTWAGFSLCLVDTLRSLGLGVGR